MQRKKFQNGSELGWEKGVLHLVAQRDHDEIINDILLMRMSRMT